MDERNLSKIFPVNITKFALFDDDDDDDFVPWYNCQLITNHKVFRSISFLMRKKRPSLSSMDFIFFFGEKKLIQCFFISFTLRHHHHHLQFQDHK